MKSRFQLISALTAVLVITGLQVPSSAQMPESLSMATVMSKAQIAKIGDQLGQAYAKAMATARTSTSVSKISASVTFSAKGRFACSRGGYIETTYTMRSITMTNSGNVTMTASGHQTLSNWRCISGWVVNGNPYISHTLNGSVLAGKTSMRATISGGWKATGPNKAKQSCQLSGSTQYSTIGDTGVTAIRVNCVPGGATSITEHF